MPTRPSTPRISTVREDLYVVATEAQAQEVAGYLLYEITRVIPLGGPPGLRVANCWDDPGALIEKWQHTTVGRDGDDLTGDVGLRRISITFQVEAKGEHLDTLLLETLSQVVESAMATADAAGIPLRYAAGQDALYFSLATEVRDD